MCENKTNNDLLTYLYNSISDIQSTIRAMDLKLNIILVILSIPFTKIGSIYNAISHLYNKAAGDHFYSGIAILIIIIFTISWLIAFLNTLRGILAIDNPANHIKDLPTNLRGTFYGGGMYNLFSEYILSNKKIVQSLITFSDHRDNLPRSVEEIEKELVFEQMKLIYIRHVKMYRQKIAYIAGVLWIGSGGTIWVFSL